MHIAILLDVPAEERKVENQRQPVPVDQKQKGEESVDGGFGNDVSVEAVAEIDGVNVIAGVKISITVCMQSRARLEKCPAR